MAAGLYRTDAAKDYMETFGIEPLQVPKGNTAKIDPHTFDKILDLMLDKFKNEEDFIIDAHGTQFGFAILVIKGEEALATTSVLGTLKQIVDLRSRLTKAGDDLKELQKIIKEKIQTTTPVSPGDPNNPQAVAQAVKENKDKIEAEITRLKGNAKFQDETKMAQVVKKMNDLKNKQRKRIELRSCNMGHFQGVMDFYREMFNAKILRATTNFSAFGYFIPVAPCNDASFKTFVKQHGNARTFPVKGGNFAVDFIPKPNLEVETPSAASSDAAVASWITGFLGNAANVKTSKFPSHFLTTAPPAFPQEQKYKDHLGESKAP